MTRQRSAAYRIAFASSAAFALAVALLGALVFLAAHAAFRAQQDAALAETSADLVRDYRAEGFAELAETLRRRGGRTGVVTFGYALFNPDGHRVAGAFQVALPPPGYADVAFRDPVEGQDRARVLTTRLNAQHTLVVGVDAEALERIDRVILSLFGGAFVIVLLIGTGGALVLGGYLRGRLGRISGTALAVMAGDLKRRVPVSSHRDEFDEVALFLNAMLERTDRLLTNLQQVSADVAHDLRTPLSRLRGVLETARDADDGERRVAIEQAVAQSDALLALFAAILRIVEVDAGTVRHDFTAVNVSALVTDLCESYAPAVSDSGRVLRDSIAPGLTVAGDRELLAQALINLLDNAQLHTPPGTTISISARASDGFVALTIADNGPGVPPGAERHIVERFVRLDRSRGSAGHGLGLNLVDAIARAHGGTLEITHATPGLAATLLLPEHPCATS